MWGTKRQSMDGRAKKEKSKEKPDQIGPFWKPSLKFSTWECCDLTYGKSKGTVESNE